ncbi:general secretion pathway protein GspB [Marinibactrum halimedae]|uniref:Type II secretion system protein GspB C-terminal domain-containing protein n=1 Tax=Marinibactrum halimedae TaxID=1444977 RepID=A0AA37T1R1_9GAMM|nr:general secretion pathway protein GspB [Marinibactrum halimedae]MCD9457477.1 general secretion pathway protein GspB [Marinibactrum halimedae]GLS25470.1 hypothetical protein GCM10007877_11840 [Marinibactrum halimedae]
MSYILDALQKSEQERQQQQQVPGLQTLHERQLGPRRSRLKAPWIMVTALSVALLSLVVFYFTSTPESRSASAKNMLFPVSWLGEQNRSEPSSKPSAPTARSSTSLPSNTLPSNGMGSHNSNSSAHTTSSNHNSVQTAATNNDLNYQNSEEARSGNETKTLSANEQSKTSNLSPAQQRIQALYSQNHREVAAPVKVSEKKPSKSSAPAQISSGVEPKKVVIGESDSNKASSTADDTPALDISQAEIDRIAQEVALTGTAESGNNFKRIDELPDAIRSEIPALKYTAHIYSAQTQKGFAIINGKKFYAGDQIDYELYLEKIDENGSVISYRGYFFHQPAMQSWDGF